jgi:protein-S-isoprenylcysteine O-methyltransferase Ste14
MNYVPILELPILILMVLIRSAILKRHGIKAIVFGVTDKTDFIMLPVILFFLYSLLSTIFNWPFPLILINIFWKNNIVVLCAIAICSVSLIWFGVTLKVFGKSFRVGIDPDSNDKLITNGTFSISRNPIYLAFETFFIGIFLALLIIVIHRQILREEKFLEIHYGKEYEEYCNKVRRYL